MKEAKLLKFRKMVESGQSLDKTLKSLNKTLEELETGLLAGKTPSLAAAEIQKILHEITSRNNVEIKTMKVLTPEELGQKSYLSIPIEFCINANIRQLKEILYGIAVSPVYLNVKKMRAIYFRARGREFRSFITVAGFMKRDSN